MCRVWPRIGGPGLLLVQSETVLWKTLLSDSLASMFWLWWGETTLVLCTCLISDKGIESGVKECDRLWWYSCSLGNATYSWSSNCSSTRWSNYYQIIDLSSMVYLCVTKDNPINLSCNKYTKIDLICVENKCQVLIIYSFPLLFSYLSWSSASLFTQLKTDGHGILSTTAAGSANKTWTILVSTETRTKYTVQFDKVKWEQHQRYTKSY